MTVCQAVAKRVNRLLTERKMSQYRLEQNSGIQHGTMNSIMSARNKGFNMTVIEFLDDPVFTSDDLEVE